MKKWKIFAVLLAILAVLSLGLGGCPAEDNSPAPAPTPTPTTGTLTIYNISSYATDVISKVVITAAGASTPTKTHTVPIMRNENYSFTLEAGGYTIQVTDNNGYTYNALVSVTIGSSTNLNFNGNALTQ